MKICALKLTHDGSLVLIDNGELIFSFEMEKLNNSRRYKNFCLRMHQVEVILSNFGYDIHDIDKWVIDGWRGNEIDEECILEGVSLFYYNDKPFHLANYGHLVRQGDNIMKAQKFKLQNSNFEYESYLHVTSHIFAGYCTSPFSKNNESSYVLVWDGDMSPQLFHYDPINNKILSVGPLFYLAGALYKDFAREYEPFCTYREFDLSISGKVMACIALGDVKDNILDELKKIYKNLLNAELNINQINHKSVCRITKDFSRIAKEYSVDFNLSSLDMMVSMHIFIEKLLINNLGRLVNRHPTLRRNLCIVGGCALNIKWNSKIRETKIFDNMWVPPFPNDSGNGIGVACAAMVTHGEKRSLNWDVYKGPELINKRKKSNDYISKKCTLQELAKTMYMANEPVLFLNGRAELGPRALGNRSILAPAVSPEMKSLLNKIKFRENYRPVAPICLERYAPEIFTPGSPDPYMLFEHRVNPEWVKRVPAIVHLDNSARLQTINPKNNKPIFDLLTFYHQISGIPLLCNTSANFHGRGFFSDIQSALQWGKVNYIWTDGILYSKHKV